MYLGSKETECFHFQYKKQGWAQVSALGRVSLRQWFSTGANFASQGALTWQYLETFLVVTARGARKASGIATDI